MIFGLFVKPRATRNADIVASVPEFTNRTFCICGNAKITISATDIAQSTVEVALTIRISYVDGTAAVSQDLATIQAVGTIDLLANPTTVTWTM